MADKCTRITTKTTSLFGLHIFSHQHMESGYKFSPLLWVPFICLVPKWPQKEFSHFETREPRAAEVSIFLFVVKQNKIRQNVLSKTEVLAHFVMQHWVGDKQNCEKLKRNAWKKPNSRPPTCIIVPRNGATSSQTHKELQTPRGQLKYKEIFTLTSHPKCLIKKHDAGKSE